LLTAAGCAPADPPPAPRADRVVQRVVSINPCVDAILMEVADPVQIAAISHYSHDPRATSISLDLARRFPAISGTAEEVVALTPDLVIAGAHVAPSTIAALQRLDIPLIQIGVPESISESQTQIRTIAAAIGQPARGNRLAQQIDDAVRRAAPKDRAVHGALIWQGGGLVPGEKTLASGLLAATGLRNMSATYGLKQWDILPLEHLVARPPKLLLSVGASPQEDRMLGHPVLKRLRQTTAIHPYPERLMHCGGPTIIDAVTHLANVRRSL
jgi:iron complex transport system substrate-binding protein